jgi:hypothetical protein
MIAQLNMYQGDRVYEFKIVQRMNPHRIRGERLLSLSLKRSGHKSEFDLLLNRSYRIAIELIHTQVTGKRIHSIESISSC